MTNELSDFTWQSLHEHIERKIVAVLTSLELMGKDNGDSGDSGVTEWNKSLQNKLNLLRWCLPLVREMQINEDLQLVRPIMSLEIIRLSCRPHQADLIHSSDFAWIVPIAEGRYNLARIKVSESQELETLWSFDGDISQIIEQVENLVKELCSAGNQ